MGTLSIRSLSGLPEIARGEDLAPLLLDGLASLSPPETLTGGEILVIAQKVVSKAEGAVVALAQVTPEERAERLAGELGKDPRAVQVVLEQSSEVLRAERGVLICRTHHGLVCANAGVDASNAARPGELILLPRDPDGSARRIRARLRELTGTGPGIVISDSFGRPWRNGQCDLAIGCAGLAPLDDWRGRHDGSGRELAATWIAVADAIAAAGELVREKDSREPAALVRGLSRFVTEEDGPGAQALQRPAREDLFR